MRGPAHASFAVRFQQGVGAAPNPAAGRIRGAAPGRRAGEQVPRSPATALPASGVVPHHPGAAPYRGGRLINAIWWAVSRMVSLEPGGPALYELSHAAGIRTAETLRYPLSRAVLTKGCTHWRVRKRSRNFFLPARGRKQRAGSAALPRRQSGVSRNWGRGGRHPPRAPWSTYGAVARAAGLPGRARMAGRALRESPKEMKLPWLPRRRRRRQDRFPAHSLHHREQDAALTRGGSRGQGGTGKPRGDQRFGGALAGRGGICLPWLSVCRLS